MNVDSQVLEGEMVGVGRVRVSVGEPKDTNNKYYKLDFIHCF
jgi:hypothetical protein